jgi:hypothetical protein
VPVVGRSAEAKSKEKFSAVEAKAQRKAKVCRLALLRRCFLSSFPLCAFASTAENFSCHLFTQDRLSAEKI